MRSKEDDRLRLRLENKLSNQGLRAPCRLSVEVYQHMATLTGIVQYEYQKRVAIQVARTMDGVSGVIDRIKVEAPVRRWEEDEPRVPQEEEVDETTGTLEEPSDSPEEPS